MRNNAETDHAWAATLEPGWQQRRMENFNVLTSGGHQDEDLVQDGWTDIFRNLMGPAVKEAGKKLGRRLTKHERADLLELADYRKMNQIRARVDGIVKDRATAEALKPWYRQFCKRPCFHDEYLDTFNRPNVELVDTAGKGVEALTETAVVANGREYEVDCLIFATGFEVGTAYTRRSGYDVIGRDGVKLSDHWRDGMRTMHGLATHGFPNCFFLGFTQTAITVSVPMALNEQARQVTYMVTEAKKRGHETLEPTAEAEEAYVAGNPLARPPRRALLHGMHARLLQLRRRRRKPRRLHDRHVRRRADQVLRDAESLAQRRPPRRPGAVVAAPPLQSAEKPLETGRIQTARANNFSNAFKAQTEKDVRNWRELSPPTISPRYLAHEIERTRCDCTCLAPSSPRCRVSLLGEHMGVEARCRCSCNCK